MVQSAVSILGNGIDEERLELDGDRLKPVLEPDCINKSEAYINAVCLRAAEPLLLFRFASLI